MNRIFVFFLLHAIAFGAYADGAIWQDITGIISNASFDSDISGWSFTDIPTQTKISTTEKGGGVIAGSQGHLQLYSDKCRLCGRLMQQFTSLPDGTYRLRCTICPNFTGNASLYANDQQCPLVSGQNQIYSVDCELSDGSLQIGLLFECQDGAIDFEIDDFTLAYQGERTVMVSDIQIQNRLKNLILQISQAEAFLSAHDYPGRKDFIEAISSAKAVTDSADIEATAASLRRALSAYYNSQYEGIIPVSQTISEVDLSLVGSQKYTLRVDGHPFYLTDVQVRLDKLYGSRGWTDVDLENVIRQVAADGFNTISVPVMWIEVEPEKDRFDWQILDKYLSWCNKYGLHMELLWFSWSSGGRVQYLSYYGGQLSVRTPDYVCSLNGTSEFNRLCSTWEYSLDWRDTSLRDRETYVLSQVMEHVAVWETANGQPHTVIGVQLGNEARQQGDNTATAEEIIDYYSAVGSAVKESKYRVWTRLNCVNSETLGRINANEAKRQNEGTNIDFVGIDIYGTTAADVKDSFGNRLPEVGKNYRMIMELGALDANSPLYQMAAIAGSKAFDYYNYCVVDGNCMYTQGENNTIVPSNHVPLIRQRNKVINLANQDIALLKQYQGLYVYNYTGSSTDTESGIEGICFSPQLSTTQAIALRHSDDELILLATDAGTFTLPEGSTIDEVSFGHTDNNNQWVSDASASMSAATTFIFAEAGCVCIKGKIAVSDDDISDFSSYIENGEFNDATMVDNAPTGWNITVKPGTSKISVTAKGGGSIIHADENHWQVWNKTEISGRMYQIITGLPAGHYTLTCGAYCAYEGTLNFYANDSSTSIPNKQNAYYSVDFVTDGSNVEIGWNFASSSTTDLEVDHVTLARHSDTSDINKVFGRSMSEASASIIYNLLGQPVQGQLSPGLYITEGKKITIK